MATNFRKDAFGDRMKRYEEATRFVLPRRTYTILRVDGRAFHSWTRGLAKPYDPNFMECIDSAAVVLCEQISGAQFAYVQSDEISVLAVDFLAVDTQAWFDGNVQKWASIGAGIATMAFNNMVVSMHHRALDALEEHTSKTLPEERSKDWVNPYSEISRKAPNAVFDARVFTVPDPIEVENYFVWRQQDAERNSVMMLARAHASHKQLAGKKRADQHEIIHKAGDNWAKHPVRFKHGAVVRRSGVKDWGKDVGRQPFSENYFVGNWFVDNDTPMFTKDRKYLRSLVPIVWNDDLLVRKAAAGG
jgi:tRNA(His) 5'-end guanylyltransferase